MKTLTTSARYTTAFWDYIQRQNATNMADLNERNTYQGGRELPSDNDGALTVELTKRNIFRQICSVVPTNTPGCFVQTLTPAGSAAFVPEGETIPVSGAEQTEFNINSHKIAQIIRITHEMLSDTGYDLRGALMKEIGRMFALAEEEACVGGNGVTQPYGILHAEKGAETGVSVTGTSINFDNVTELYFSLEPEFRRCGSWLMNDQTAFMLRRLKDSAGNPLWRHSDDTIFGKPVVISPFMPDIATGTKPIAFGDFSFYWLFERGSVMVQKLDEMYYTQGQTGYKVFEHIDGRLVKPEAVKVLELV